MPDLANDPRALETQQAGANNSIISNLAGASSPAPMSPPPAPASQPQPAAGGDFSALQGTVPQGAISAATQMSDKLYGSGFLQGGEKASDQAIQQLFNYDQMLDKGYSPFPQVQGYVENPADMYAGGAAFAGGMGSIQNSMNRGISTVESGYQAAISGLLDKFTSFYQMKQEEEERRRDREYRDKRDAFETSLMIAKLVGGDVTLPDGKTVHIDSDFDRELRMKNAMSSQGDEKAAAEAKALELIFGKKTPTAVPSGQVKTPPTPPASTAAAGPNYSGVYRVMDRATGQTGTIPSNEFDPKKYTFIK